MQGALEALAERIARHVRAGQRSIDGRYGVACRSQVGPNEPPEYGRR